MTRCLAIADSGKRPDSAASLCSRASYAPRRQPVAGADDPIRCHARRVVPRRTTSTAVERYLEHAEVIPAEETRGTVAVWV